MSIAQTEAHNRRHTRYVTAYGETHPLVEWAKLCGLTRTGLMLRLKYLYPEEAVIQPKQVLRLKSDSDETAHTPAE